MLRIDQANAIAALIEVARAILKDDGAQEFLDRDMMNDLDRAVSQCIESDVAWLVNHDAEAAHA